MWVLKRTTKGGGYVAKLGHPSSYVKNFQYAAKYLTQGDAVQHSCPDNEIPVNLEHILDELRL